MPRVQTIATVIGRGHGGTRAAISWLQSAGFDIECGMGLNNSQDRIHRNAYECARIAGRHARHLGGARWDFSDLLEGPIDPEWVRLMDGYLDRVLRGPGRPHRAWKLPETLLSYPWLVRQYPEIRFLIWHRDPRDAILKQHGTDDLGSWGVQWDDPQDELLRRALSWVYQFEIVRAVEESGLEHASTTLRLRDFVYHQRHARRAVSDLLGVDVPAFPVKRAAVGRHKSEPRFSGPVREVIAPYIHLFRNEAMAWGTPDFEATP